MSNYFNSDFCNLFSGLCVVIILRFDLTCNLTSHGKKLIIHTARVCPIAGSLICSSIHSMTIQDFTISITTDNWLTIAIIVSDSH